jgi:hypothetical protein
MDMENKIFKLYKEFIIKNSAYSPEVFNDIPQQLAVFPTITFTESDNRDSDGFNSVDRTEFVDVVQYKIDIYTKNKTLGKKSVARKLITNELKQLTKSFLRAYGFRRTSCNKAEYLDLDVDRTVIVAECNVNSWNGKIR